MPDGTLISNVPEGTTQSQLTARYQKYQSAQSQPSAPEATALDRTKAFAAGANRGFADLAGVPADTLLNLANLAKAGIEAGVLTTGHLPPAWLDPTTDKASVPLTSDWLKAKLGAAATVPRSDDTASRYLAAAGEGAASASVGGGAAIPNTVRSVVAGTTGALSSQAAKESGAGPATQMAAGLLGGLAPGGIEEVTRQAARVGPAVIRPLTQRGQEQIAADIIGGQAINPTKAAANLRNAQEVVPGSQRTTGEASKDIGLLALEKGVRGRATQEFGQRLSEQNAARQDLLSQTAGTPQDVGRMTADRGTVTTQMRDAAFANKAQAVSTPVTAHIDSVLASPVGKRDVPAAALKWARAKIDGETDPENLYAIRQDIGDAMAGKLGGDETKFKLARKELMGVRGELDNAIEAAAPGFKAYLQRFSDLSKPIDQAKILQEIKTRAELTSADITTGKQFLSNDKFARAMDKALETGSLTKQQIDTLKAVRTDLQYGQAINSPLVKAPGSDTFQNLSIAQVIGAGAKVGNHPVIRVLTKPLDWLYRFAGTDQGVNEVLKSAMLDPKLAATLLDRATPKTVSQFSARLRSSLVGTSASQLGSTESKPTEQSSQRELR